jgi:hypothetical protein
MNTSVWCEGLSCIHVSEQRPMSGCLDTAVNFRADKNEDYEYFHEMSNHLLSIYIDIPMSSLQYCLKTVQISLKTQKCLQTLNASRNFPTHTSAFVCSQKMSGSFVRSVGTSACLSVHIS